MLYLRAIEREHLPPNIAPTLADVYNQWFEVIPADTPALLEEVYRLRYQVYCRENPFENPTDHPQHKETDAFDHRSIHSLIIDRASGSAIGTVRLIRPDRDNYEASLPIQKICLQSLPSALPLSNCVEISRFALSKKMRGMVNGELPKGLKCSVILGLMKAIVQMSREYGITDWLAAMEPSLLRLLSRFGLCFAPLGPLVDYHGMRQPCHANVRRILETVRQERPELWAFVTESDLPRNSQKIC